MCLSFKVFTREARVGVIFLCILIFYIYLDFEVCILPEKERARPPLGVQVLCFDV